MNEKVEIRVGDTVCHVSNIHLAMGVEEINDGMAFCTWLDKAGKRQSGEFKVAVLRHFD